MLDRVLVEETAFRLRSDPGLIEKDWHATRALAVLAALDHRGGVPAFGGGTSLSKGWQLIKRFSEDIDFKVALPAAPSRGRTKLERSAYREHVLAALVAADFVLAGEPFKRDGSSFFSADLFYPSVFGTGPGLRPHLRVEMSLAGSVLPPTARPITSLISKTQGKPPEVAAFFCVDPVETAADKLSALAWRVQTRRRGSAGDDPTIVRHLHDLAALKASIAASDVFTGLVQRAMASDQGRGGETRMASDPAALFADMLTQLRADPLWEAEYRDYVRHVSFAPAGELIEFDQAMEALRDLIGTLG